MKFSSLTLFLIFLAPLVCFGKNIEIKVAVLDNLQSQKLASEQYEKDYFLGIDAVVADAKSKGITIICMRFMYGKDDLDILNEVEKVKKWGPDVIIGPRSSNKFLMLRSQFKDILVISPLATATSVSELPNNFFSLTPSNDFEAEALVRVTKKLFPKRGVFKIVESDCKNCSDMAHVYDDKYKKMDPNSVINETKFLNDQSEKIAMKELLFGYTNDDVILLANTSYSSGVLSARISDHIAKEGVTFIGGDDWGSWKAGYFGKVKSKFKYRGIRVIPWSLDGNSPDRKKCEKIFTKKYGKGLPDAISLVTCHTLSSIVELATDKKSDRSLGMKERLLSNLIEKTRKNYFWARPTSYAVHEVTQNGEKFLTQIGISSEAKNGSK
jgi:ABC-type branched-subunit amino acid transport system substrate-binding protein